METENNDKQTRLQTLNNWRNMVLLFFVGMSFCGLFLLIMRSYNTFLVIALPLNLFFLILLLFINNKLRKLKEINQNSLVNNEVMTPFSNLQYIPQTQLNMQSRDVYGNYQQNFNVQPFQYQQYSSYQQTQFIPQNQQPQIQQQNQMNWNNNQQIQ